MHRRTKTAQKIGEAVCLYICTRGRNEMSDVYTKHTHTQSVFTYIPHGVSKTATQCMHNHAIDKVSL